MHYEIFTGRRAFESATVEELLEAEKSPAFSSPSSAVRELSAATEQAILRCLDPDPSKRPGPGRRSRGSRKRQPIEVENSIGGGYHN